ncbi:adenylate/guanylate cyclase domain-containing protein [Parasedimentitalea huanghaiensis]|uniref:Adenylate/guanylate cyclase domain-containing protein n=1 Tax=Parasedimentitalea huanghaiensis TaxID=2682100 RepID=A0A6L6WCF4_9RHOB|nr:adenylate/guanylate cyclase domain-containing protein [Zongyanglinia huanghaiensis]MVO15250.1 adenylate/guanylate cyclase domain-containing protein [Zongyanglinia huanghaiensis]
MSEKLTRKLTTILAADAAGFSQAMGTDEVRTFAELNAAKDIFRKLITHHGGRIANTAGDGFIADFPSAVEATQCAIEAQRELGTRDGSLKFRIGVHLGDVIVDGDDLIGEGVNLAARLQSMAEPGGVLISQQVYDQVHSKLTIGFEYLGEKRPRNLSTDVPVYRIAMSKPGFSFRRKSEPAAPHRGIRLHDDEISVAPSELPPPQSILFAALVAGALVLINLVTGGSIWAHWPILGVATIAGLRWAPQFIPPRISAILPAQTVVIIAALALINIFSWGGYPWSLWPIGALVIVGLGRKILSQPE